MANSDINCIRSTTAFPQLWIMSPGDLKKSYLKGHNLMKLLRKRNGLQGNDEQTIELSYDIQSGAYIRHAETVSGSEQRRNFGSHLVEVLKSLGPVGSLLEAGVGEATTLWHTLMQMETIPQHVHGFDLSWSRAACASRWLGEQHPHFSVTLCIASLRAIPYLNNSFDVIYTAHAIEPNGGQERDILSELYRVANRYLVLLEPAYEFAPAELRARMDEHGYCRGLAATARALGYDVTRHEPFSGSGTPNNPTSLVIIAKNPAAAPATPYFACPSHGTSLQHYGDCLFSDESMLAYPVLRGIPCLRRELGIIASKLTDFMTESP